MPDQLALLAEDQPEAPAIVLVDVGESTFGAWDRAANRVARGLLDRGVRRGDRVAVVLGRTDLLAQAQLHVGI